MAVVMVSRWVFLVARGMVLAPFVVVEHIVLKCCQAVLSWLKTFLPSSSLTNLATCAILPFNSCSNVCCPMLKETLGW